MLTFDYGPSRDDSDCPWTFFSSTHPFSNPYITLGFRHHFLFFYLHYTHTYKHSCTLAFPPHTLHLTTKHLIPLQDNYKPTHSLSLKLIHSMSPPSATLSRPVSPSQQVPLLHSKEEIEPEFMEDLRVSGYSPLLPPQIIQEELPMVLYRSLSKHIGFFFDLIKLTFSFLYLK